ncbi:POT family MFS transporter [Roseiconus lacunae]|uniref:POT family MFS transporter n=1 Tax=Roseiconus lacunae TaxID=2605694 RepID=A0ABT7PDB1_9BACT|nr:POT family MFS transporter [Roseiconus lacunae]MCD0458963.1 POT family MFS transporter [Roseiconus lacunae]MDM4014221.1 POT family MFS transporter [Roseiconus lacunae]WRQ53514.1 POT family MFS transporter [Stieleria sp. HD01]
MTDHLSNDPYQTPQPTPENESESSGDHGWQTTPYPIATMPPGIPYIVGNEAAERFSFYGMKAILTVFMTQYLLGSNGELSTMNDNDAKFWMHTFVMAAYFTPILGAVLADWLLGKYRTILYLSVLYCIGHLALALDESRVGLAIGLGLIAFGTGAIKPCVSAHVGDQFGKKNSHLLGQVFGWFYIAINLGAFLSTLLTPLLLEHYGSQVAFGVPGVLMAIATLLFWMGRHRFVHIPARGPQVFKDAFTGEGLASLKRLAPLYLLVAVFWSLFDQTASAWVLQAENMDRNVFGVELLSSQIQAANPFLILVLVPLFTYVVYPAIDKFFPLTPLRKIGIGMFITVSSFTVSAFIEQAITAGGTPNISWQVLAYVLLTSAEVMVSITCLEFSYTQSPNSMKSIVMSVYLLSVSFGNAITAFVNAVISNEDGTSKLEGASYYWFFTGLMLVAAIVFVAVAMRYRGKEYIQEFDTEAEAEAEGPGFSG